MPNWCQNVLHLTCSDDIANKIISANNNNLFSTFLPTPRTLQKTVDGSFSEKRKNRCLKNKQQKNLSRFGAKTWYDWNMSRWGTKWDVKFQVESDERTTTNKRKLILSFDTAWSPPINFYEFLESQDCKVEAFYAETGCGFAGHYSENENSEWELDLNDISNIPLNVKEALGLEDQAESYKEFRKKDSE